MPRVKKGESEKKYVSRAIPIIMKEKNTKSAAHAAAKAHGIYRQHKKRVKRGKSKR